MTILIAGNYKLLLTLNAADIIIRAEHQVNKRLYESTFTSDDFAGCEIYGGLEAVGRIILTAFRREVGATVQLAEESASALDYTITVAGLVPIQYILRIFSRRREPRTQMVADVEELREECASLREQVTKLEVAAAVAADKAAIILPGCPVPIPTTAPRLELSATLSDTLTGCARKCCDAEYVKQTVSYYNVHTGGYYQLQCKERNPANGQHDQHNIAIKEYISLWTLSPYDFATNKYVFTGSDISELKYMKNLRELHITNPQLVNASAIGELKNLHTLTLRCSALQDISWITGLQRLQELNLEGCAAIRDVSMCKELPLLTKLNIKGTAVRNTEMLTSARLAIEK